MLKYSKTFESFLKRVDNIFTAASDPAFWALDSLSINLYDNQIEIVNAVCDLNEKSLAILQARGAGKTYSVGLALVKICLDIPGVKIGVFGPKAEQACRIIKEITHEIVTPSSKIHPIINWNNSTNARLSFFNNSEIIAISAAEATMQEGYHFNIVVLDECHRISDISVNQRIIPMLGSLPIGKIIKIGISMYRQNFWKSCCAPSTNYKVLSRDWTQCPILLEGGSVFYKGKEYPKYVLQQMPLSLKEKMFPDRPDLHSDGSMTETDFKTQYGMEWVQDINLELSEEDQKKLVDSEHVILDRAMTELQEPYFFGLDTASGSLMPGKRDLDYTALSIWRRRSDNVKEKVRSYQWQGDVLGQIDEIKAIVHPKTGIFPCAFGLADYSNIAIGAVESFKKEGIPVDGIVFSHSESITKKNYKNAMFDQFKFELQANRVKFPSLKNMETEAHGERCSCAVLMKKSFNEWCNIERHKKLGINDKIEAPADFHDDHCCADVLAVWAMDRTDSFAKGNMMAYKFPSPIAGPGPLASRGIPAPGDTSKNRYLK